MRFASRTFRRKKHTRSSLKGAAKAARTRRLKQRRQRTRRFRRSNTRKGGAYPVDLGQTVPSKGSFFVDSGTKYSQVDDAVETSQEVSEL